MDAFLPILCLLLGVALPVAAFFLVGRRAWRQLAVAEAYRTVSHELGLEVDTRGVSIHGHLGDRRLYVGSVLEGHGVDRRIEYRAVIGFEIPLGLGLQVRRRASRRWFRRARTKAVTVGNDAFDRHFEAWGDDEERVRALLTPKVLGALAALTQRWPEILVTDHHVRVALRAPEASEHGLRQLVAGLQALVDALLEARRAIDVPPRLEPLIEPYRAVAEARGLELDERQPAIEGQIGERKVRVTVRREEAGYAAEIRVWLIGHRITGLRLRPQVEPDGYWSVGQDIQIGDPRFDPAFVIKGYDPEDVRRRLGPEAREKLLALQEVGDVEVDDRVLRIRRLSLDADEVAAHLDTAVAAAAAMGW